MTRPPRPPRPATPLARLLARLGDDLQRVPIDPAFGRRVEARIRAGPVPRDLRRPRAIPSWAAVAAGVLLTLGAGLSRGSAPAPFEQGTQVQLAPPPAVDEDLEPPLPEPPPPESRGTERGDAR